MPRGGPRQGAGRKRTKPAEKPVKTARPRKRAKPATPPPPPPPESIKQSNANSKTDRKLIDGADKLTTAERQRLFLEEFSQNGNVTRSCQRVGVARGTVYQEWMKQPEFKAAFDSAAEEATDLLEEEARRRALEGVSKPVYQGKELVGHIQEYSDSLMQFLLRGKRDAYREKRAIGVGVESGGPGGLRKVIIEIDESPGAGA